MLRTILLIISFSLSFLNNSYSVCFSGQVGLLCDVGNNTEVAGVEVTLTGQEFNGLFFQLSTVTDQFGNFSICTGSTTYIAWTVAVTDQDYQGFPGIRTYSANTGNQTFFNFNVMGKAPVLNNTNPINYSNQPWNPKNICSDDICLNIDPDWADEFAHGTNNSYCFTAEAWTLSQFGFQRLKLINNSNADCLSVSGRPEVQTGCAQYEFPALNLALTGSNLIGSVIEVEFTQSCCTSKGDCNPTSDTRVWSHYYLINGISNASVDFDFSVTNTVDINNTGDPIDFIELSTQTLPGPALGRTSTGLNATISSNEIVDEIAVNLYEIDCNDGGDETLVNSLSFPISNNQPNDISFVEFEDDNGDPYFVDNVNHIGKCFKVEYIASNDCGTVDHFSFFTIDPNEWLTGDDDVNLRTKVNSVAISPNPFSASFEVNLQTNSLIIIYNVKGQLIQKIKGKKGHNLIDSKMFMPGLYYINILDDKSNITRKIIKQ